MVKLLEHILRNMNGKQKMNDYSNKLIYGCDTTERIVSIEVSGSYLIIFQEMFDGTIKQTTQEAYYWLLTNRSLSEKETKLVGNGFFKHLHFFDSIEQKTEVKKKLYQKRIEFYSIHNDKEANLVANGMTYFKGMKPEDVSTLSFDIETDGLIPSSKSQVYLISNTFRKLGKTHNKTFSLADYNNQSDMLIAWCNWVREIDPSVIVGHNIFVYDFFYLRHVAKLNDVKLNLGRDGSEIRFNDYTSKKRKDGSQDYEYTECFVFGRELIDTFFLSLTFDIGRVFPSYGLKPIIKYLGLEKEGRSFVDASKMRTYFNERDTNPENWNNAVKYANEDSDDALKLYDMMIPAFFYLTQCISFPWQKMINSATGSQINSFLVRSYLQEGKSIPRATEFEERVEGGISFAIPGIYRNLKKVDLRSAYPSQILRFKLYDKIKDPEGNYFKMVEHFANERFELKRLYKETGDKYYKDRDATAKVFLNSAYGVTITKGLHFNSPAIGAKITESTREVIDLALQWASGKDKNYWIDLFNQKIGNTDVSE